MKWQQKLTKKELRHLRETECKTLEDVKRNVAYQSQMRFPCWSALRSVASSA
ncbi:MAG: hypothetical protein U9P36_07220 [Thermodesulfobacteriota bacterium]|nr:hypothetical protein [Thermodesulfobacteriota bacterium]